ncbi:hypothetical protein EMPS_08525 [Entomortierella parvispora]|uniref:Uncharacterized protein n=1 Tax=Entomortierella parvispora TaxID=205924 RepID=A0A9P3LZ61_9FUNG|nr:hypothetical protein EMPS_08525 [Entomortierella parvispora]
MFGHVYPAWHKPAQKAFFVLGVILCIALPVAYGSKRRRRPFKAAVMGAVLGVYFGLWLLFTLVVRFLIPSPKVESSLPIYTPSPIPVPVVLHSPALPNAVPFSPAIRLHPSAAGESNGNPARTRGARFADDTNDDQDGEGQHGGRTTNNVTFQTRPRGYTVDSTNSEGGGPAYPTFADYRQAQQGNLEAFAQRIKRVFANSQQQQQELLEQQQMEQQQSEQEAQLAAMAAGGGNTGIHMQSLSPGSALNISQSDQNASNRSLAGSPQQQSTTRSRSASAASILGDFAERIKNGTLFSRSQTSILPIRSATDSQTQQPQTRSRSGTGLSISDADLDGRGGGDSFPTAPAIEIILASDSDEQLLLQRQQQQMSSLQDSSVEQGAEPKRTDQSPRGNHEEEDRPAMSLTNATPLTDEEKVETEKDARSPSTRLGLKRQDSEDTVVVTMDGIRRPSVNGGQARTNN